MRTFSPILYCFSLLVAMPVLAEVRSKLIWIEQGGAFAGDSGGFHLLQIIGNTSEQPLWLTVRQGEEPSACEVAAKIEPKKRATFNCEVAELKPGKVPVVIAVFADEARTENLETHREEMRFGRGDLRALREFATAQRLPITYEGIACSEKLGIGSLFRQFVPHANGTLEISTSAVEYVDGKRRVTVPVSRIRGVDLMETGAVLPWIVVIYEVSGKLKRVGFQPLNHPEHVERIVFSLQAATMEAREGR